MAYFPVPEGRGGILTILHGRADILQLSVKMNGVYAEWTSNIMIILHYVLGL